MDLEQKLQELKRRDQLADEGGGPERRERQHKEGKMAARAFKKAWFRLLDMQTFFCATRCTAEWCRNSRPSWDLAPAVPCIHLRSRTSSSWWIRLRICSSPAPTSSRR